MRVVVDERGLVSRCFVTGTSGNELVDETACRSMLRFARFRPALDENGEFTEGSYTTRITYVASSDRASVKPPIPLEGEGREVIP